MCVEMTVRLGHVVSENAVRQSNGWISERHQEGRTMEHKTYRCDVVLQTVLSESFDAKLAANDHTSARDDGTTNTKHDRGAVIQREWCVDTVTLR